MKNHPASHRRYLRSLQAALANPTESRLSIRFPPADASGPKHLMLSILKPYKKILCISKFKYIINKKGLKNGKQNYNGTERFSKI